MAGRQTTKERDLLFVHHYVENGGNAYQAALAAGFSEGTAMTGAGTWVKTKREDSTKPDLWDMVQEDRRKRLSHLDVTEDRILTEYARIAFFDPCGLFDENGELLNIKDMDEDTRRVIGGLDISQNNFLERVIKFKLEGKKGALDSLARIMGMNQDKVQVDHSFSDLLDEIHGTHKDDPLVGEDLENLDFSGDIE